MKKHLAIFTMLAVTVMLLSFEQGINSNGAPIASTGAPSESTCAKSTCHNTYAVNSGDGLLDLQIAGNAGNSYTPGATYRLTVSLNQSSINRFGFQLQALKNADNTQAGTLVITDSLRTQTLAGGNEFTGRNYATYKYAGTEPYTNGLGQWSFDWIAPEAGAGDVTFYYAGVAANNDGSDYGDLVYTKQLTLLGTTTGVKSLTSDLSLQVFPNPVSNQLTVTYNTQHAGNTEVTLLDLKAGQLHLLGNTFSNAGLQTTVVDVANRFAAGIYVLQVKCGNHIQTQKVVIQ